MKKAIWILLLGILQTFGYATTLTVAADGSEQYTHIQAAITAANTGDVVLVSPGRYVENVDFMGKTITVCSKEATTGDTTYIRTTIIDGNRNGACVSFRNAEQNAVLRGFTITNGSGNQMIEDFKRGGGISIYNAINVIITNCEITGNRAAIGGGIYLLKSSAVFSGLKIHHNYTVAQGGGIALLGGYSCHPAIVFDPVNRCSVYENYGMNPTDILVSDLGANLEINLDTFTVNTAAHFYINRHCNLTILSDYHDTVSIQRGYREEINHDLYVSPTGNDNNSGFTPQEPLKTIAVAVHRIASDSLAQKSVYVLPGTYVEGESEQIYPIPLKSYVNIVGAGSDQVTLYSDVTETSNVFDFVAGYKNRRAGFRGFRITEGNANNRTALYLGYTQSLTKISDILIENMSVYEYGAIYMSQMHDSILDSIIVRNITTNVCIIHIVNAYQGILSNSIFENCHSIGYNDPDDELLCMFNIWVVDSLTVQNCIFRNLSVADNQALFHVSNASTLSIGNVVSININNCLFDNLRTNSAAAIYFSNNRFGEYNINNCTFVNNHGLSAAIGEEGKMVMHNNLLLNPENSKEIYMYPSLLQADYIGNLTMDYNYVRNGSSAISNPDPLNTLHYGEHNILGDPLLVSTTYGTPGYMQLDVNSPCIDSGTPDTLGYGISPYDLSGNCRIWNGRIDMGCYEYGSEPYVGTDDPIMPLTGSIQISNYPNPFRESTMLRYSLPEKGRTEVEIFNLKGQLVKRIESSDKQAGEHYILWYGKDESGSTCGSGVYFCRVRTNGKTTTHKMLLLK